MPNIKLTIQYHGSNYCGWQVQKHRAQSTEHRAQKKSIQGTIEKVLEKILQEKVRLIGAGRTDAGVHAIAQVANFKTNSRLPSEKIPLALNSLLPADIKIIDAKEVDLDFHAQFSAKSKVYKYFILNSRLSNPFFSPFVHQVGFYLNIPLMRRELKVLKARHNFKSFCATGSNVKSYVRTIKHISISLQKKLDFFSLFNKEKLVILKIEADGFLYNMVRNIVGTLIDIGRGYLKKGDLERILKERNRKVSGRTAPAHGLHLVEVKY